jgi:hypothetical protein
MAHDLTNTIDLNNLDLHKSFPIEFAQNKNLSDSAIALGIYLHSLPKNWTPRPFQLKAHFGWGKRKWDKVCGELKKEGYMKLYVGKIYGGSKLSFSIYKTFPEKNNVKEVNFRESHFETVSFCDSLKKAPHRSKQNIDLDLNNKTTTNNKEVMTMERDDKVVVEFEFLMKEGFSRQDARALFEQYGEAKCRDAIKIANEKPERPGNLPAYIRGVLKRIIVLPTKKGPSMTNCLRHLTPEETKAILDTQSMIKKSKNTPSEWKNLVRKPRSDTA